MIKTWFSFIGAKKIKIQELIERVAELQQQNSQLQQIVIQYSDQVIALNKRNNYKVDSLKQQLTEANIKIGLLQISTSSK